MDGSSDVSSNRLTRILGGRVLDGRSASFTRADIALEGNRIGRIGQAEDPAVRTEGAPDSFLNASGLYLLPGLIDCHVHLVMRGEDADPAANASRSDDEIRSYFLLCAARTLHGGTTTVRDVGGWNHIEMEARRHIERGVATGPRLLLAGRLISAPTPAVRYYPGMYEVAQGEDQLRNAVQKQLDLGADVIKVMATGAMLSPVEEDAGAAQLTTAELKAVVEASTSTGTPVAAHAHALAGIRSAVEAGVASIEHGTFADTEILSRMADADVFLVPTIAASESVIQDERLMQEMPTHIRERLIESHHTHIDMVRRAHDLGVPLAMGTDAGTPGNHHGSNAWECVHMVNQVGIPSADVIQAATKNGARLLGREGEIGTLEAGAFADLIGIQDNPLEDISALTRVELVVKGGTLARDNRSGRSTSC
jgi:imidazolonepropionase-like amidohydrolase